ncbi:MAG: imidazoleglycerol-phosphate dehydratase [Clostridiales bacterium]|jgi:imidazoleglycerol-phosphate dehydratase|nr:imidazoleglycerol-phosphate dehydratase [Clostridiales bacterium]
MKNKIITVKRKTTESEITVTLDFNEFKKDYRKKIQTPLPFLNHMIEHIAWRSEVNIEVDVKLDEFNLNHLVCEDVGITFGKAVFEYVKDNMPNGVTGFGDGTGIIDEAMARSVISFENRAYFQIDYSGIDIPKETEGMLSEDLETFLEGFVQGAMCTLHVDLLKGHNGHHIWEAIYRSFGTALNRAFTISEKRKGMTSGVAGKIEFEVEKK